MQVSVKNGKSKFGDSYFDVTMNNVPLVFNLTNYRLNSARGVYSTFTIPSPKCSGNLKSESVAYLEMKDSINASSLYQDILLDLTNLEHREVYKGLCDLRLILQTTLVDAIQAECAKNPNSPLAQYINSSNESLKDELNMMFLKNENCTKAYLHMKFLPTTKSYHNDELVSQNFIMYKNFDTRMILQLDNVRIPRMRNANNKLNIHLCITKQDLFEV
jgi:hypothetical protein